MKLLFLIVLALSTTFSSLSWAKSPAAKTDLQIAQRQCRPIEISGEKEKTLCSLALSVLLTRTARTFCQRGEVCIAQPQAFSKETLGQTLYILERDLPKNGYTLKLSAALLFQMIDRRWATNADENSVSQLVIFLSPYVTGN